MLEGRHTGLRAIEHGDLAQLLEWRNRPDFRRYFREVRELSMADQERWYENVVLGDSRVHMFAITDKDDGRLMGACGLCYIDWVNRSADLSIYIGLDGLYIDDVLAPDAARTLLRYGFDELGLHRIWAEIYDFDTAKQQLFKTLGLKLDGRHREAHWAEGAWHDSLFYGILDHEFTTRST